MARSRATSAWALSLLGTGLAGAACTDGIRDDPIAESNDVRVVLVNPTSTDPMTGVDELNFEIVRGDEVLFAESFEPGGSATFPDMTEYGVVRFRLAGFFGSSVVSYGRSAEVVLVPGEDLEVALLFLPVNRAYPVLSDAVKLRSGHGSTRLPNGRVMLFGGINQNRTLIFDDTEFYDPVEGTFLPGPLLPGQQHSLAWAWSGELELFGAGGVTSGAVQTPTDMTWRFDPAAETVEELGPFNEARAGHCFTFFRETFAVAMGGTDTPRHIETLRADKDDGQWRWSDTVTETLLNDRVTGCETATDGRVFVQGLEPSATGVFDYTTEAAARNSDIGRAFTAVDGGSSSNVFLDGAMLVPLSDGDVWVAGGMTETGQLNGEGRNFDMDNRIYLEGVDPDEARVDGSWDHWLEDDWVALGCGSPDGDVIHSQPSVELLNLDTGERLTTVELDRNRPGCQVDVMADGSIFVSGGYGSGDDATDAPAVIIVPFLD